MIFWGHSNLNSHTSSLPWRRPREHKQPLKLPGFRPDVSPLKSQEMRCLPTAHTGMCHHGGRGQAGLCWAARHLKCPEGEGTATEPSFFSERVPSLSPVTLRLQQMLFIDFLVQHLQNTILTLQWSQKQRSFHRISGEGHCQEHKTFQANLVIYRYKAHHFPLSVFSITGNLARTQLPSSGILWNVFILAYQHIRYAADIQLVFLATSSQKVITMSTCSYFKGKSRPTALLSFLK